MKIAEKYLTLQPAYGRNYKNKTELIKALEEGKDFILHMGLGTTYANKENFAVGTQLNIRQGSKLTVIKVTEKGFK